MNSRVLALVACVLATLAVAPAAVAAPVRSEAVPPTPVAADEAAGKKVYERNCMQCHGAEGAGDGPAAEFVYPKPRDFRLGMYKIRTTLSGQLPTDHDLFKVVSQGIPGTSMPAWERYLSEEERWQAIHYIKRFDMLGLFEEEPPKERIVVGGAPKVTDELVARGKQVYQDAKCWQCHGQLGRGDGPSASGMTDDWDNPIRPVNFTKSWIFRGGSTLEDIYRTFTTGFNGTPMPSFAITVGEEDRWALAAYVKSLARERRTGQVVRAAYRDGPLPGDAWDAAWDEAEPLDVQLAGQIILEPRWFAPAHDAARVQALYNDREIAVMVSWDDGTHDEGQSGPPDQVALQLPLGTPPGTERPYFVLGDRKRPVDYWRWNAANGLQRAVYRGHDRAESREAEGVDARGAYREGQYRVVYRRALDVDPQQGRAFAAGDYVPLAVHLWDGQQGEEGMKMAISGWHYLLLQPPTPLSAWLWPAGVALLVCVGNFALLRRMRRRESGSATEEAAS
ncbi:MAG: c-type cytochrome [Rhodocyclales bacterium]|nr:c-type cytochrome [Rhodocyclales bacterium]